MKVSVVQQHDMNELVGQQNNSPDIHNQKAENLFQAEMRKTYDRLVYCLSSFGEEGDYYGVLDFAVRPDLRDRPTVVAPPAPHLREFHITVLTPKFHFSDYLRTLHGFLSVEAPNYRVCIATDFSQEWFVEMIITADHAWICGTNAGGEMNRLKSLLSGL